MVQTWLLFAPFKPTNLSDGFDGKTLAKSWGSIGCWMQYGILSKSELINRS